MTALIFIYAAGILLKKSKTPRSRIRHMIISGLQFLPRASLSWLGAMETVTEGFPAYALPPSRGENSSHILPFAVNAIAGLGLVAIGYSGERNRFSVWRLYGYFWPDGADPSVSSLSLLA